MLFKIKIAAGLNSNHNINGYNPGISPNSYGKAVSLSPNTLNNLTKIHPNNNNNNNKENNNKNYINWSGMPINEHQTYAGYLKKQGALFKQWKERYFVLDSLKHQVN